MTKWIVEGLRTGIKTTPYPRAADDAAGVSPGFPLPREASRQQARALADRCPTSALVAEGHRVDVRPERCVHCFRCLHGIEDPMPWHDGYEWAVVPGGNPVLSSEFWGSLNILVVDAGDCGACLNEVRQLDNPYYNMHRLGFFITPTPRNADILLVVGALADHMRVPLRKAYEAMPTPKRVLAVGACALSGNVFGRSFACEGGVSALIPVDVEVPGNPPPPLAILHGLLVLAGRQPRAALWPRNESATAAGSA